MNVYLLKYIPYLTLSYWVLRSTFAKIQNCRKAKIWGEAISTKMQKAQRSKCGHFEKKGQGIPLIEESGSFMSGQPGFQGSIKGGLLWRIPQFSFSVPAA